LVTFLGSKKGNVLCNRLLVQGSGFKGCVHPKPACGSEQTSRHRGKSSPPSKALLRTGTPGRKSIFHSIARKLGKREVTLNGEPRTCERLQCV
jgi:hypothetical protein